MSNSAVLPIAENSPDDSVAAVDELPLDYNYAGTKIDSIEVDDYVSTNIIGLVQQLVSNRSALNDIWAENRRMELMIHDENQTYKGRSDKYMPAWAKANKVLISQMASGLFPSDEYLDVACISGDADNQEADKEAAAMMKAYMQYQIGEVAKLPNIIKPFCREMNNTGTAVIKQWWNAEHKPALKRGGLRPAIDENMNVYNEGIMASVRSIHNVYVYPVTAEHPRELQLVAEITEVPNSFVRKMGRLGKWKNTEYAQNNSNEMNAILEGTRLLSEKDKLSHDTAMGVGTQMGMTFIIEIYTFMKLDKRSYLPGEDTESELPVQIFYAGGKPLMVRRNPFYHQCMPYLFGRDNVHAGSFYGFGMAQYVKGFQYLANDFANQGNDASTIALNPFIITNPAHIVGTPPRLRPGVVWRVTDIDKAVRFDRPPTELITAGQSLTQFFMGAVADFGGAPPVLQGQSAGKGARTATGAQILQRNALQPLQDVIEDIEADVCVPFMKRGQTLARQYQDRRIGLLIGGATKWVSPEVFDKEYEFRWMASSQMVNQQMRARQVGEFLQMAMPLLPLMMQQGYQFNPTPLLRKVFFDGMGFRGFDDIFTRAAPYNVIQQQMGAQQSQLQSTQPQSQSAPQVSAFPGGEQMENPVPGEGDAYQDVKSPAQEMAALMGGLLGAE